VTDTERMALALERIAAALEARYGVAGTAPPPAVPAYPPTVTYPPPAAPVLHAQPAAPVRCPYHDRELKPGRRGLYCSGKGGNGPLNAEGWCEWTPGRAA
jgi:hypothetical protein